MFVASLILIKSGGGVAKASLNRAIKQRTIDPKPDELTLARVNLAEMWGEARTGWLFKTFG